MKTRTQDQIQTATGVLVIGHSLNVEGTDVIASSLTPIPITLHRSSRYTVIGDLTLAMVVLVAVRIFFFDMPAVVVGSIIASGLLYWSIFRMYYDIRKFKRERLILMPPNLDNRILLHELLHVSLGHIRPMSLKARIIAMTPIGPFVFWPRAVKLDYGKDSGVTRAMREMGEENPGPFDVGFPIGLMPMALFMIVVSPLLVFLTIFI